MHVFVCYHLTTDFFYYVLYWGLALYLLSAVTDWQIDGMQMYVNVSVLHFCFTNTYLSYRERPIPGGANFCVMPGSWSGDWFTDRCHHECGFLALPVGSTKYQHHYQQG
jgi:hypothetical protein